MVFDVKQFLTHELFDLFKKFEPREVSAPTLFLSRHLQQQIFL